MPRFSAAAKLRKSWIVATALVCLLLGVAVADAGSPSSRSRAARALPSRFFGVNFFGGSERDYALMQRGRIRSMHFAIGWSRVEAAPMNYDWRGYDGEFTLLARYHIEPLPFVTVSPGWAVPGGGPPLSRPALSAWSRFLRAVVNRYGPGGTFWAAHPELRSDPIRSLAVWNEPNFPAHWGGPVSARKYTKLLRASAKAIRSASPGVKVSLAGLGPGLARRSQVPSWKFLGRLYNAGAKPYFDVVAENPFAPNPAAMADQLRKVARVMRRHRDHAQLWITELGWSSGHVKGSHLAVGPRRQARKLTGAVRFVVHHARQLHIKRFEWFAWRDPLASPALPHNDLNFGLRRYNFKPKPSWRAYVHWTRR